MSRLLPRLSGSSPYSGFTVVNELLWMLLRRLGCPALIWFGTGWMAMAGLNEDPYPRVPSKKGLQVQMVDDAIQLGIKHAALNFNLGQVIDPSGDTNNPTWTRDGRTFHFQRSYLAQLDSQILPLSDHGIVVSLILLNYVGNDPAIREILVHPGYDKACPNALSAANTRTPDGRAWWEATVEFLANRWSGEHPEHGRVWNWIVGNEVNSHWFWSNMGRVRMEDFANDYLDAVRGAHRAIRSQSAHGRVFLSLEHHWNIHYPGGDEQQTFPARVFLEYFAARARSQGDFDWGIAYHPYPENLFNPRTWLDQSATDDYRTTPRITFRNLEQLGRFLSTSNLLWHGAVRPIILSEQGFHTPDGVDGEAIQAAAFCYAWKKVEKLKEIDAFILHRHVDHGAEGGLRLGLWSRRLDANNPAEPLAKKRIYEVFRHADADDWAESFRFALPIIGARDWSALMH